MMATRTKTNEKVKHKTVQKVQQMEKGKALTVPLISVIVPIYNVARYVRKCLDSLAAQTMKQIEVICIDDGSTDESGRIADEYKNEDGWPIFRVIHTSNRGLSSARNKGLDEARAEWIMFVDSDDWVNERFCEIPWKAKEEYRADLVCFRFYKVSRLGRVKKPKKKKTATRIVDQKTAHEFGGIAAWNKLYKLTMFSEIRFPEDHVHEELATAHRFVNAAERIVLLDSCLYYYIDRKGSISNTHSISYMRDRFEAGIERYEFLIEHGYPSGKMEWTSQRYAISLLTRIRPDQDAVDLRATEIVNNIRGIPKEFSIKQKLALIVWRIDKRLFYLLCRISGRIMD